MCPSLSFNEGSCMITSLSFNGMRDVEEVDLLLSGSVVGTSGTRTSFVTENPDLLVVVTLL